jgi:large subunit ribosomal protein L6
MSRIGKQPVLIPNGVEAKLQDQVLTIKGPKGTLTYEINPAIKTEITDNKILFSKTNELQLTRSLYGLTRTLVANMVEGVTKGFSKTLEIIGVGFKIKSAGKNTILNLGFSHEVVFPVPQGIEIKIDEQNKNKFTVLGIDKELVGKVAANIRQLKKPEPYKGKGIKYENEHIIRKAGKAAGAA